MMPWLHGPSVSDAASMLARSLLATPLDLAAPKWFRTFRNFLRLESRRPHSR